jgi:hypothetical protein
MKNAVDTLAERQFIHAKWNMKDGEMNISKGVRMLGELIDKRHHKVEVLWVDAAIPTKSKYQFVME